MVIIERQFWCAAGDYRHRVDQRCDRVGFEINRGHGGNRVGTCGLSRGGQLFGLAKAFAADLHDHRHATGDGVDESFCRIDTFLGGQRQTLAGAAKDVKPGDVLFDQAIDHRPDRVKDDVAVFVHRRESRSDQAAHRFGRWEHE